MKKWIKAFVRFILHVWVLVFFLPVSASALSYTYTCADFPNRAGIGGSAPTCTGDVFTFTGQDGYMYETTAAFTFVPGNPYYFVVDMTGTGDLIFYVDGATSPSDTVTAPQTQGQFTITAPAGTPKMFVQSSYPTGQYNGDLSNFCVSDTSYAECAYVPPPDPPASTTPEMIVYAPGDILFQAFVVFFMSMAFIVWLMRK